ncbi:uncharacterized protein LOC119730833 [Patiria miniata]|uniref:THAP-type domain-containing protein n=1 Tax=Patiria miniata TaxID=46514 RepID=A0A914A7H6_PATMI|nr:uncharacterized protein LOC119730833 [Patiria miniata]
MGRTRRSWREKKICAMDGCPHNAATCPSQQFYCFPSENETRRRQLWIALSGKANHIRYDGSPWSPGRSTRLCACHFEGGRKNNEPRLKVGADHSDAIVRLKEWKTKKREPSVPLASADHSYVSLHQPVEERIKNKQTQVCFPIEVLCWCGDDHAQTPVHSMYCCVDGNDVGTQTSFRRDPCGSFSEAKERRFRLAALEAKPRGFVGWDGTDEAVDKIHDVTGVLPDVFFLLYSLLPQKSRGMSLENCLLLFLMKLRHGQSFSCLGVVFSVSRTTASRNFQFVLDNLCRVTRNWIVWPSAEMVHAMMPSGFSEYPNARCILDCLEFKTEKPAILREQVLLYSPCKGTCTCKVLVVSSPNGLISFLSRVYTGSATDSQITVESGFLNMLEPDDEIVASKGFPDLARQVAGRQAVAVAPPLAIPNRHFKAGDVAMAYNVSSVRVRVERVVQRIRLFNILSVTYPSELLPYVDDVVHMCAVLANLQNP